MPTAKTYRDITEVKPQISPDGKSARIQVSYQSGAGWQEETYMSTSEVGICMPNAETAQTWCDAVLRVANGDFKTERVYTKASVYAKAVAFGKYDHYLPYNHRPDVPRSILEELVNEGLLEWHRSRDGARGSEIRTYVPVKPDAATAASIVVAE